MSKFFEWLGSNRKPVGYSLGALNILVAVNHLYNTEFGLAVLWFVIGSFLIWDAYDAT